MSQRFQPRHHGLRRQRGIVLYVAIIVLVAMTLAGLAMMRQTGAGTSIAGNIAFKEAATAAADRGTEYGRAWIASNGGLLDADHFDKGYHSSWSASVDPGTFNWDAPIQQAFLLPPVGNDLGNSVLIYIERLCATPNMASLAPTQVCSDKPSPAGASKGGGSYPSVIPPTPPQPYFRVTTRVDGPRNTRSYTQVVMQ